MSITYQNLSLTDFLALPEEEPALEYFDGEVVQKPMPDGEHSRIQATFVRLIDNYAIPLRLAASFPELRGRYDDNSLVPDVAVYRWGRITRNAANWPAQRQAAVPDIAIEIQSPDQSVALLRRKAHAFLAAGVNLVFVVFPGELAVSRFGQGTPEQRLMSGDRIDFSPVLPDFALTVGEFFDLLSLP